MRVVPRTIEPSRVADFGVAVVGRDPVAHWYGVDRAPAWSCGAVCDTMNATGVFDSVYEADRSALDSEWFIAADNLDVTIKVSAGWRVDRIPNRLVAVRADMAGAAGIRSNNVSVEHFTHADARGGRFGSFAFAVIPCTSTGIGSATFRGGRWYAEGASDGALTCDTYDHALAAAVAPVSATWSLTGDVVGSTSWPVRLVVFDLPR